MINKWTGLFLGTIIGFIIGILPWTMGIIGYVYLTLVGWPEDSPGNAILIALGTPLVCSALFALLGFLLGWRLDKKVKKN